MYYGLAHFLVTFVALVWLFRKDPRRYPLWRNTLALTTCLAVIGFAAYSLMPPRLLDDPGEFGACQLYAPDAVDGWSPGDLTAAGLRPSTATSTRSPATAGGSRFGNEGMKDVSNQYAAMPSMHIGWSTWSALVLVPLLRRRWAKVLAALYPVITLVCIVLTANHYWIDGVGGPPLPGAGSGFAGRSATGRTARARRRERRPTG